MSRRRSAESVLKTVDKILSSPPTRSPKLFGLSIPLQEAILDWQESQAQLIREGAALCRDPAPGLSEDRLRDQVRRGLALAWARYLAATDARAAFHAATAFGIFFDKVRLLAGLPTQITEERRWERIEVLARIQALLVGRQGVGTGAPALPVLESGSAKREGNGEE